MRITKCRWVTNTYSYLIPQQQQIAVAIMSPLLLTSVELSLIVKDDIGWWYEIDILNYLKEVVSSFGFLKVFIRNKCLVLPNTFCVFIGSLLGASWAHLLWSKDASRYTTINQPDYYFFGQAGVWTQGFALAKQRSIASDTSPFCSGYLEMGVSRPICPGCLTPWSSWSQPPK
jgi:hypothetical protein